MPEIIQYKMMDLSCKISMLLYVISVILMVLIMWTEFSDSCHIIIIIGFGIWMLAKGFMYLTFLLRLKIVYGESCYAYSTKLLVMAGSHNEYVIYCILVKLNYYIIKTNHYFYIVTHFIQYYNIHYIFICIYQTIKRCYK